MVNGNKDGIISIDIRKVYECFYGDCRWYHWNDERNRSECDKIMKKMARCRFEDCPIIWDILYEAEKERVFGELNKKGELK